MEARVDAAYGGYTREAEDRLSRPAVHTVGVPGTAVKGRKREERNWGNANGGGAHIGATEAREG